MTSPAPTRRARRSVAAQFGSMSLEKIGVRRFDWTDPYHVAVSLSWPAFLATGLALYVVVNLLFALAYVAAPGSVANMRPGSLGDAFFFSVQTLATVGYGVMAPSTLYAHLVSSLETFVGLVFTAMMTGLVFVRFSRPQAKLLFADTAVVTLSDNGRRTLMIRVGNGRAHPMMDASARITTLVATRSPNGQSLRRAVDLKLARGDMPFFPLTWTLMHVLDDDSVLARALGDDADAAPAALRDVRLLVSVTARDPLLDATVSSLKVYDGHTIALATHYVDAVSWDGENRSIADMRKISLTEPDA